jgi:Quinohemoprotein amine dehydrogenase, gamma subunit
MRHMRPLNKKAARIDEAVGQALSPANQIEADVIALQDRPPARPHVPMGCSIMFTPGWEVDAAGGTAGLCQPVERDIYDCFMSCYWPAAVPDHLNNAPDWTAKCAAATKDWRNLDIVFP